MVLTPSICRRPRRIDLAVFSDIASLQSDPPRGREQQSLVEGVTTGGPEIKAHFVRTGCKSLLKTLKIARPLLPVLDQNTFGY